MVNEESLDLIDRGSLTKEISKIGVVSLGTVLGCLSSAPTVDAVEVVRCEECKHYRTSGCAMDTYAFDVVEEGFCSYGERKEYEKGYTDAMDSIVRCKDCKHYCQYPKVSKPKACFVHPLTPHFMPEDGFCSYGERREGE